MRSSVNEDRFKSGFTKARERFSEAWKSSPKMVPIIFVTIISICAIGAIYLSVQLYRGDKSSSAQTKKPTTPVVTATKEQPAKQPAPNTAAPTPQSQPSQPSQPTQPTPPPWANNATPAPAPSQPQTEQQPFAKCTGDLTECALANANTQPRKEVQSAPATNEAKGRVYSNPGCLGTLKCWFYHCTYGTDGLTCVGYMQNNDPYEDVRIDLDNAVYSMTFDDPRRRTTGGSRTITFDNGTFRSIIPHDGGKRQFILVINRPPAGVQNVVIGLSYCRTDHNRGNHWVDPISFTVPVS